MRCVMPFTFSQYRNTIGRPSDHVQQALIGEQLRWFIGSDATIVLRDHKAEIPGLDQVFGFARALTAGCAFAAPSAHIVRFVGWQSKLIVRPGTILLDATADIDGVSQICPWREHAKVPQAHYGNLDIVHVPQHTKKRISEYLKTAANQRSYAEWMVETIKEHMAPGERGLVICKKALFDAERVPQWPEGDLRLGNRRATPSVTDGTLKEEFFAPPIGVQELEATTGKTQTPFPLYEFFIPKRIAAATVQGLRGHRADEGDLGSMTTLNSKASGVDRIAAGHRLRWTKQLALRGRARSYDEYGNCGKQRLVISSDLESFMSSAHILFPGAKITTCSGYADNSTWAHKAIEVLNKSEMGDTVTTKQLTRLLGKPWRSISRNVLTPEFESALVSMGWRYVPGKGRKGSRFDRKSSVRSLAPELADGDGTATLEAAI